MILALLFYGSALFQDAINASPVICQLAVRLAEAPSHKHSNQWEFFRSVFETPPALFRATHKCQMVHMYHFITYFFFYYFVLNITLPLLSSTISRLMGLALCHQELEPSSSSVPCLAQLSNTIGVTSTLQTVVIQYEARSLIMLLRPTKCDAQLLTPFMLLAL